MTENELLPDADSTQPGAEEAELQTVLAARHFSRAPNLGAILRYVCQEVLEGRSQAIREYNIAVHALGRRTDFDPTRDSVVRVEVSRLRKRLRQYYSGEGAGHEIQILLPDFGYVPRFVRRNQADLTPDAGGSAAPESAGASGRSWRDAVAAVAPAKRWTAAVGALACLSIAVALLASRRPMLDANGTVTPRNGTQAALPAVAPGEAIRIAVGSTDAKFVDKSGAVWSGDRYFTGGVAIGKPERKILRTLNPALYQKAREGEFQYDIPLKPGIYELHLHFTEIALNETLGIGVEGQRRFHVTANGKALLTDFDVTLDAPGSNTANEKVFTDIEPAQDGFLHLRFSSFMNKPILSGIEILPGIGGRMHPVRILTGPRTHYDSAEQFWGADRYFVGGRSYERAVPPDIGDDPGIYGGERFGNFSYFIPVANSGRYTLTLRFLESNFGVDNVGTPSYSPGGVGSRVFDVYCNGTVLLKNFDVYKEAGGPNRAIRKSFHGVRANAQGKIVLSFVAVKDYPMVRAIEVVDRGLE